MHMLCLYTIPQYRDENKVDENKVDMAMALLAAARGHHTDIVKCILQKDQSIIEQEIKDMPLREQAIHDDLSCIFEVRLC